MNIIWTCIIVFSMIILLIKNPAMAFESFLNGSKSSIELTLKLWAIYAVWLGLLKIIEDTKLNIKFSKILSKPIKFLFGNVSDKAKNEISTNLTCNIFGMGNASIPSGINAMSLLEKKSKYASNSMIMLMLLNTCNLQIFPATIIGMKLLYGSTNSSKIILPTIFVSLICVSTSILLVKLLGKIFKEK